MNLITALEQNSLINNTKGGKNYASTFNANLNLFSGASRFDSEFKCVNKFLQAYNEDKELALANLLYILDIREGKGERKGCCRPERSILWKAFPWKHSAHEGTESGYGQRYCGRQGLCC